MRRAALFIFLFLAGTIAQAQTYFIYENSCTEPGQPVITQGLPSVTPAQINHIPCQVNVFLHGTSTRATLFSDDLGTPLGNPFNSQVNGYYHFEVNVAGEYDVTLQNTVTGNPTFPLWNSPFSISGIQLGASGAGGGGTPGGSTNDVQINAGGGTFGGTSGHLTYDPGTQTMTFNGSGGLNVTGGFIDFHGAPHTIPNFTGTTIAIAAITCGNGWTAVATDGVSGQNYYVCGSDNAFHQVTGILPGAPGVPGQFVINVGGNFGVVTGLSYDSIAKVTHFPGGGSFDSNLPFSVSGTCPAATPLGTSTVGTALFGWDVGCIPKISFNGNPTQAIGLQGLIDYTYLKLDSNNCLAIGPTTGDFGIARQNAGVGLFLNCLTTTSGSKLNIAATYSSTTNYEVLSQGWSPSFMAYFVGADHGSLGGAYHPLYLGAAGITNPFWQIATVGPLTCLPTNPNCDLGSITVSQQMRNVWINGFIADNIIGPNYPVNASGVQIGLVAVPTATSPVQATTATTTSVSGTLGIVAYLSNGSVTGNFIANGGTLYSAPVCGISLPTINSGIPATCTATQLAGVINTVTITNTGSNNGYQSIQATQITITDPTGSGAVIVPIITATGGFAGIAQDGSVLSPIFDGAVSIRNQVVISPTVNGELHDSGISCSATRIVGQKVYGCSTLTSAGAAGQSVPMQVNMREVADTVLLGVTPSATTCPTAAPAGSTCKDTITISPAQPDTNYFAECYVASITTGFPVNLATLTTDKAAGSFKVMIVNGTAAAAQAGTYDCSVRHK